VKSSTLRAPAPGLPSARLGHRRSFSLWAVSLSVLVTTAVGAQGPGGPVAPAAQGIWDGIYTSEQAERGRMAYEQHCSTCHGVGLKGGSYRALEGDRFWASFQETTVDRLLHQITTTMPFSNDGSLRGSLTPAMYADIMAYILSGNGFPAGARELSPQSVDGVRIVRKDGASELPAGSFAQVVGCLVRGEGRNQWRVQRASSPTRVERTDAVDTGTALGSQEFPLLFVITSLDKMAGHRVAVRGTLVGAGGAEGINVTSVTSTNDTCP
jgi:S-disulfanyl-L-cysteine oxidoreductase SoxD